ncbi:hypothetical protein LZ32DRAFT_115989 [Colletotrichum eremochloae]|nr:hypothetical protein LZ32DRAFT_115989 [Colletotrichum eremochloae]
MYDAALWGFRSPVRDIEKRRPMHKDKTDQAKGQGKKEEQRRSIRLDTYTNMHELSRHLVHSQETLNAAETTFQAILRSKQWDGTTAREMLEFCHTFVVNLKLRAGAFVDRLDNEIALELHINNLDQLEKVEELLKENRRDGKEVTKFVGYASILFLPGTFLSGFFSMTFFAFDSGSWPNAKDCWIWFALAIPITAIGWASLWWSRTKDNKDGDMLWKIIKSVTSLDKKQE